jgi:hypothetical protein
MPTKTGKINLRGSLLCSVPLGWRLEEERDDGDSTDETGIRDVAALGSRVEDRHARWGDNWDRRGARRAGSGSRRARGSGADASVASSDRSGDIGVACGCSVSTLASLTFDNGDGGHGRSLVRTLVTYIAFVADARVDRADCAGRALAAVTGRDGRSPGGHLGDGGLGGPRFGVLAGQRSLAGRERNPARRRSLGDADVVVIADVSSVTVGAGQATDLCASHDGGSDGENGESGVEDHFD